MDWSDKLEWLEDLAEETGVEPTALQKRPEIFEHLSFVWSAWWELHTDRPIGMGVGAIPFSAIDRYADRYNITGDAFEAFRELIRAMEGEYFAWQKKRSKKAP